MDVKMKKKIMENKKNCVYHRVFFRTIWRNLEFIFLCRFWDIVIERKFFSVCLSLILALTRADTLLHANQLIYLPRTPHRAGLPQNIPRITENLILCEFDKGLTTLDVSKTSKIKFRVSTGPGNREKFRTGNFFYFIVKSTFFSTLSSFYAF